MPQIFSPPAMRPLGPGASQTYVAGTGASVCISSGPNDGYSPVCISVSLLPSASWKVALAFVGRLNSYYAASKDVTVLTAMGITGAPVDSEVAGASWMFGFTGNGFFYHVMPSDVTAEVANLTALVTSGNISKGGNP